jgi:hypothetical protein
MTRKRVVRPAGGILHLSVQKSGLTRPEPREKPRRQAVVSIDTYGLPPFKSKLKTH